MKPRTAAVAVFAALVLGIAFGRLSVVESTDKPEQHQQDVNYSATVIEVADGDTCTVVLERDSLTEKIRLLAIDTPERGTAGYAESREALMSIVLNNTVRLEFEEPGVLQRDKYGRILAYLIQDGKNVNIEMVRLGWSAYTSHDGRSRFSSELVEAEEDARQRRLGIWGLR